MFQFWCSEESVLQLCIFVITEFLLSFPKAAGNAVKRASDNLVRAAQKAAFGKAEDDDVVVKTKFVGGIAQVGTITNN